MLIANNRSLLSPRRQPLTNSQREIWFAAQMSDAASAAFNQSCVLEFAGRLDTTTLLDALHGLVARHDALRTTFSASRDEQRFHDDLSLQCPMVDLLPYPEDVRRQITQERLRQEVQTPFDLTKGPMIRAVLLKVDSQKHLLALTVHHLICDGASLNLIIEELAEQYSARRQGAALSSELPLQFSEFVAQQLDITVERGAAKNFWLKQFEIPAPFLELPQDHPRPSLRNFKAGSALLKFEPSISQAFKSLATKNRCSLFAASLAALYVLLQRLTGQDDIVIGVPMSARSSSGSHAVVGHCINFLPLRLRLAGNPSFISHLGNVRGMLLDALDHVNYDFGSLIQELNLPRHPARAPLISTMFNVDHIEEFHMDGVTMEVVPNPFCLTNFDFSLSLEDHQGQMEARCLFDSNLFKPATIDRWLHHLQTLLQSILARPDAPIHQLSLLTPSERQLLMRSSGTEEHLIHDLLPGDLATATRPGTPKLEMFVLDPYDEIALIGVEAEICIAGLPLSEVQLPADKLARSPFAEHNGGYLFRTGHRAKYLANGDIEIVKVLPGDTGSTPALSVLQTAASEIQDKLTQIWRDVMRLDEIGSTDDFFDLGGHSLLIAQIITRVRSDFGTSLSLRNFFDAPTIGELAQVIESQILHEVQAMPDAEAERLVTKSFQPV